MSYQIVEVEQGSDAWLAWRATRLTASQAPSVMGCNPWFPKTPRELYKLRTGQQDVFVTQQMRAGNESEPRSRELARELLKLHNLTPICAEAQVNGLPLGASLDGVGVTKAKKAMRLGVELKRPGKGSESPLWKGEIGDESHYLWQMAHQMLVVDDIDECVLVAYAHDLDQVKVVARLSRKALEGEYMGPLLKAWREFEDCIAAFREPPPHPSEAFTVEDDEDFFSLEQAYELAAVALKEAEERADDIKSALIARAQVLGGGSKVLGRRYQAIPTTRVGAVNWKAKPILAALAAASVDPEEFRGKSSTSWSLRERGES
jgi:putative phage-type endonuclease